MRYELKEFQEEAALELAQGMTDLMDLYVKRKRPASCCLSAPTGSGKTVIAAAVIEALLSGNREMGIKPDPDACMLWVTDLPSLADQTKAKLLAATDLEPMLIESIQNTFTQNHDLFEPRRIYFIHRQLLGKGKLLTKGGETKTFWQVIKDSVDSGLHLYMFLDEAHRGIGSEAKTIQGDETIYSRLIDGYDGNCPMPVVVGISATPKRFVQAMANRTGRNNIDPIRVSPSDVQASGLLKDDIVLLSPKQRSAADALYLGRACKALDDATTLWKNWCGANGAPDVKPLMVVQVEDRASDAKLLELAREIQEKIPWLEEDAFAHVMGDHEDRHLRGFYIPYISPEEVERHGEIKVLFAKEAISTGWDCPRAEVIYSMRKHTDETYIAQLVGRMIRTPLARRVDVDTLNSVKCFLPLFDERALESVKEYLTQEDSDDWSGISVQSGRKVITNPIEAEWNSSLGVDEAFESVVKRIESHHPTNVIEAAYEYASLLARYEIDMSATKAVEKAILDELQDSIDVFSDAFEKAVGQISKIISVELHLTPFDVDSGMSREITQSADVFAVAHARDRADHVYTNALTNAYFRAEHAKKKSEMKINISIAAAASVDEIVDRVNTEAREQLNRLTKKYSAQIEKQPEPVRIAFASALSRNGIHRVVNLRKQVSEIQDGDLDEFVKHVISNKDSRKAHLKLNPIEKDVVKTELQRGCVAFYRNPSGGIGEHVLTVIYQSPSGGHYTMHPDFLFFEKVGDVMMPSIIDPHGEHYSDALPKMRGLCNYVDEFGDKFARIWCIDGTGKKYVDLKDPVTRAFIREDKTRDAYMVFEAVGRNYSATVKMGVVYGTVG